MAIHVGGENASVPQTTSKTFAGPPMRHARWVSVSHWIVTASFLTLAFTGFVILMAHPRLYWGDAGNDLTPALFELPISRNYRHGGWDKPSPSSESRGGPISANRTYDIFNQNGWGRSLHFLAAWCLVLPGAIYLLAGIVGGHFRAHLWPRAASSRPVTSGRTPRPPAAADSACVGRAALRPAAEVRVLAGGLRRAPLMVADRPGDVAGGDRGLSLAAASVRRLPVRADDPLLRLRALLLFVFVHVVMVVKSGFRRQMRAMTLGE